MSTTQTDPTPPPVLGPVETAPSAMVAEAPTFTRITGMVGLGLFVLGAAVVIATKAVGPRWFPARIVRRAARPLPSSVFCSFRMRLIDIAAIQCGLVAAFESTCPIHERVIRPCEMVFINTEIAVET